MVTVTPLKYVSVAQHLRQLILSGGVSSKGRLPSISALRTQLKVTQATIDSALALLHNEGLIERRPGSGIYTTGASPVNRINTHGILLLSGFQLDLPPSFRQGGWGSAVFFGALAYCHSKAFRTTLLDPHRLDPLRQRRLQALQPAGILMLPSVDQPLSAEVQKLCAQGIPTVAWDCSFPPSPDVVVMAHDHAAGAQRLTEWLIARGHRRILQLASGTKPWMLARREGHLRAMAMAGLSALPMIELKEAAASHTESAFIDKARSACAQLVDQLVGNPDPIDAIMASSDGEIFHLARACRLCGREPNRDVALVGYDNYWSDSHERAWEPLIRPLATIDKSNQSIGILLIEQLIRMTESASAAPPGLTPPALVIPEDEARPAT